MTIKYTVSFFAPIAGLLTSIACPNVSQACTYNPDGSPVVTSSWMSQTRNGDNFKDTIADDSRLLWIGGAVFNTGDPPFYESFIDPEAIRMALNADLRWLSAADGAAEGAKWSTSYPSGWRLHSPFGNWLDFYSPTNVQVFSVDKSCFMGGPVEVASRTRLGGANWWSAGANAKSSFFTGCTYSERTESAGPGSAAVMLSGFTMPGWGFGEWTRVNQGASEAEDSTVTAHDEKCDDYAVEGRTESFAVSGGVKPPRFIGPGYDVLAVNCETCTNPPQSPPSAPPPLPHLGSYGDVGTWQLGSMGDGFRSMRMAKTSEAICYLVGLSGKFMGQGEFFYIDIDGDSWRLNVSAFDGSVSAMVNCFAYNQQGETSIHPFNPPPLPHWPF